MRTLTRLGCAESDLSRGGRGERALGEQGGEVVAGVAALCACDGFGGAGGNDVAALVAAVGAEVDDPVGGFDDVEVVFDDHHRVAGLDQRVEDFEEFADVFEV